LHTFYAFSSPQCGILTPAESTLVKVYQNKQLKLPLESTLDEKQGVGDVIANFR
jgi:hypothetical protein